MKVDNGVELDELHDVLISSASTDQALVRASDGLWKNRTIYASTTPAALGTAGVGTSTTLARADHVHAMPSAGDVGADPSGTAAAAVAAHVAAADPHPVYTTAAEAAAAAPVQSVAGRTGAITLGVGDVANAVTTTDARLSDARTPLPHTQTAATITDFGTAVGALFTTVGNALRSLVNPSAVSFFRINADNSVTARSASEMRGDLGLTSAATATIGTAAGNLVALDGSARLPAVDASQLTGLVVGDSNITAAGLSQSSLNGRPVAPFAPFTVYSKGDLASLFGLVYRRKTPGTSGATLDPAMWDLQSAADGSNDCFYTVGKYFNPSIAPLLSTNAIAQNTIYFYPFIVRRRVRVNGIQVRVTTAAASTTFQVAFYAASSQRVPTGLPLANTADMTMAATGAVNSSISQTWFEVGQIYFRAINVAGSSSGILLHPSSQHTEAVNLLGSSSPFSSATNGNMELTLSWTAGTWPDMTARTTAENYFTRAAVALLVSELG